MIECSNQCIYQLEGVCTLSMAAPPGIGGSDCIHYVPNEPYQHEATQKNPEEDEPFF